jgi:general secretion pathway protein D
LARAPSIRRAMLPRATSSFWVTRRACSAVIAQASQRLSPAVRPIGIGMPASTSSSLRQNARQGNRVAALCRRLLICSCLLLGFNFLLAADPTAAQFAREARKAQNAGLVVRAWMLYTEAAQLDPKNASYVMNREALAPLALMMSKAGVQTEGTTVDELRQAAAAEPAEPNVLEHPLLGETEQLSQLRPPPELKPEPGVHSFDTTGDDRQIFQSVAAAYGVLVVFDPAFEPQKGLGFRASDEDFHGAMSALTSMTDTFLFPISPTTIFVARDTPLKRDQFEPVVAISVPLPDAADPKDVNEAANAVKGVLQSQRIILDGATRTVLMRERVSKAKIARSLLESLLQPKAQVTLDVELLSLDEVSSMHYGLSLPTSYPFVNFGQLGGLKSIPVIPAGFTQFLTFGGGATLIGIGITNASAFAISSKSWTKTIFQIQLNSTTGLPASLHVGDKYPIAQTLYTGPTAAGEGAPFPNTTQEDLGVVLKVTPHVFSQGDVGLDIEVSYKSLGATTFAGIPEINEHEVKASVRLSEDEWAVVAGLDADTKTLNRTGIFGLVQLPYLNNILAENTSSHNSSKTMIVIKPRITLLPPDPLSAPQFLFGGDNGAKVLL